MLLTEMLPVLAQELQQLLQAQGQLELATQIPRLAIVERCRCGDDFCASFYTQPKPKWSYGPARLIWALLLGTFGLASRARATGDDWFMWGTRIGFAVMTALAVPASSGAKAMKVLAEYIHLPQYLKTKWRGLLKGRHIYDNNGMNRFWEDAQNGRIQPNDVVCLKNVILTEWFPRAPGAHLGWQKGNAARHDEPRGLERPVEDPKIGPEKRTGYWSERLPPAHGRNAGPRSKRVSASLQNIAFLGDKLNDQTHIFEGSEEHLVLSPKRKTLVVRSGFGNLRFSLKPEGRLLCAVGHSYGCPNAAEGIPVLVRPQRYDKIADRVRSGVVGHSCRW
jgi:hypothetical protein